MPRMRKPQAPNVPETIAKITQFCEVQGISVNCLARMAGVKQSALFRFLNDDRKTVTPSASKVVAVIDSWHNRYNAINQNENMDKHTVSDIMKAALGLWDGNPETLGTLFDFLKAVAPVYQIVVANRHQPR